MIFLRTLYTVLITLMIARIGYLHGYDRLSFWMGASFLEFVLPMVVFPRV